MSKIPRKMHDMTDKEYVGYLKDYAKHLERTADQRTENNALILLELVEAALEIGNLKPFVSQTQLDASLRIKQHINKITKLLS